MFENQFLMCGFKCENVQRKREKVSLSAERAPLLFEVNKTQTDPLSGSGPKHFCWFDSGQTRRGCWCHRRPKQTQTHVNGLLCSV